MSLRDSAGGFPRRRVGSCQQAQDSHVLVMSLRDSEIAACMRYASPRQEDEDECAIWRTAGTYMQQRLIRYL